MRYFEYCYTYFIFIRKTKNEIDQTGMLSTMSIFSTIWLYIFDESSGEGSEVVGHKKSEDGADILAR